MLATASEQGPLGPRAAQRGRPRDASRDEALRQAALEVMAEVGYRALTMDAVATRARAGKATIYRRWESKLDLVIDTTNHLASQRLPEPDTGSLAGDLTEFLTGFARFLTGPVGKAAQALVGELPHEPELAEAFRGTFLAQQDAVLERILDRGRRRGEVRPDAPVRMVVEVAGGALVRRLMLTGQPLDELFVDNLVRGVLLPLLS
ncbi:transcriptional regulator, TetR family [Streptoalloteichus tenebrarius]|uniref:Transcriptional regulator, TetR family n=1 Tax=Streptoalloteichus tenebrarius (strain ATCC 17920 / DSM 40477 / JCM 4838 / CBS 697.72 / NBRC 16177 / NCIMB 11028 / NRRL B-12390 / A12253. 1 / ISP 5477) TaxID=1933 RepID=A0ABT1I1X1_STRSD|nr:transcriptional regulator, TetR family [Streptoalloteichus tenebrarius]BFF00815.1 TetR/AcrR family transcriptional regulator [Streptoalloteichus tenebrarius]